MSTYDWTETIITTVCVGAVVGILLLIAVTYLLRKEDRA